ncbi:1-deoxy-D-xylulose-5-phosphate synthase [candidate division TA06 bacterium]|uniref:1-deoxy-D-xylulose-5-phosphate synthase n=1 Tax=candidate division TA06 bacterium TaxID=2250710 RepID=A0A523UUG8_UNCT6|nr:MAG: 1-deoxy-D-xylulose-5-phosphate synthase [candidate division TA06 bacterium]
MSILEKIESPADLRELKMGDLKKLAGEIRAEIIDIVSRNGGHLAPNLGVVELTLALHYVFDAPRDKLIWDVGHQSYTHKIVTGRREQFHTLRTLNGISGFPRRDESHFDVFGTGHSSTSISASLGLAAARDLKGEDFRVIAVIGDGALTAGMAFEGLNQAGHLKKDLVVILNDNEMSISENVGALSEYLTRITMYPIYNRIKDDVWELLGKLPKGLSSRARDAARRIAEGLKNLAVPSILFEELGFRYVGPLDGHNMEELITTLNSVKRLKGPILVHVLTQKGRGYSYAEENPTRFHGLGSFDVETGLSKPSDAPPDYTDVFGRTLVKLGMKDKRVVAITGGMREGTGLRYFADRIPDRFFDVGIAEQHAVTFACSMALAGLRPVAAIYSTFLQRAFDQVLHDVCLQNSPVVFCMDRSGIVGEDGPTHHGTFDLSYLRLIPNMIIMAPKDENELRNMLLTGISYTKGPVAIRYPKGAGVGVRLEKEIKVLPMGKAETLKKGKDVAILAIGSMVYPCLEAAKLLKLAKIDAAVINARFAQPIDEALVKTVAKKTGKIVTVEENVLRGGFGSGVIEILEDLDLSDVRVLRLGLPNQFVEHGSRDKLLDICSLTAQKIADRIANHFFSQKGKRKRKTKA